MLSCVFPQLLCLLATDSSGFTLPHPRNLHSHYSCVLRESGFYPQLEKMLTLRVQGLQPLEKLVSLSFYGMHLTKSLHYSWESDVLVGFEDHGRHGRHMGVANKGVFLMVKGLTFYCKQRLGFFIANSCILASQFGPIIEAMLWLRCSLVPAWLWQVWWWIKTAPSGSGWTT